MGAFFQQVIFLLTTNPGSLAYNLVVAFSIVAGLLSTLYLWRNNPAPQIDRIARRMSLGLSLLLIFRMALFLSAGLAWQQLISLELVLPPLERGVDILSLLVIIWLWAFPEPDLLIDLAAVILGLVILIFTLTGMMVGLTLGAAQAFNASTLDLYFQIAAVGLAVFGVIILSIRRPQSWTIGLVMIVVLGAGHLIQLLAAGEGDYPGAVRLSQMIAYPLLLALPGRLAAYTAQGLSIDSRGIQPANMNSSHTDAIDPRVQGLVLDWIMAEDPRQAGESLAATLAQDLQADVCLFLWPPNAQGRVEAHYGYDVLHHQAIPDFSLESKSLPVFMLAFQQGQALRLPSNSTAPDLRELASALSYKRPGPLLSVPVLADDGRPVLQVVMLSPFSGRRWQAEDEDRLASMAEPLAHILQRNRHIVEIQDELNQANQTLQSYQERMVKAEADRSNLIEMVSILQEKPGSDFSAQNVSNHNGDGMGHTFNQTPTSDGDSERE
jgi:hypothetical protein